jgi:hypothetical protein
VNTSRRPAWDHWPAAAGEIVGRGTAGPGVRLNVRTTRLLGPMPFALFAGVTPAKARGGSVVVVVGGSVVAVVRGVVVGWGVDRWAAAGRALVPGSVAVAREPHALRLTAIAAGKRTAGAAWCSLPRRLPRRNPAMGALLAATPEGSIKPPGCAGRGA